MGGLDIVLDDGSHHSRHMRVSFETLFPLVTDGGIYVVEDTHACYWRGYSGAYRRRRTFIEYVKRLIDDMHQWYHPYGVGCSAADRQIASIQFFDSMIVIRKKRQKRPAMVTAGAEK
jgi:hypothetical protein